MSTPPSSPPPLECPYCELPASVVTGEMVYPHRPDLAAKVFWQCLTCGARVGCHHNNPATPMGTLANEDLRRIRRKAHERFDAMWQARGWGRGKAYRWLSDQLKLKRERCHIGQMDWQQCAAVLVAVEQEQEACR